MKNWLIVLQCNLCSTKQFVDFFAVSLSFFIMTERRSTAPLIDLKLIKDKFFLPSTIIVTLVGMAMFMIYPTIVQLVRSPQPLGFGRCRGCKKYSATIYDSIYDIRSNWRNYYIETWKHKTTFDWKYSYCSWFLTYPSISLYSINAKHFNLP